LCPPEESRGEGMSKQWKVTELPLSGEALVLDTLVGLMDEVLQLQTEVHQHGKLIISGCMDVTKGSREEVENQEQREK